MMTVDVHWLDVVEAYLTAPAGGVWNFEDDLTITKQGAQYRYGGGCEVSVVQ